MLGKYEFNKIYNEDCYSAIKNIPDNSIDLIIIDPPYEFHSGIGATGIFKDRTVVPHKDITGTILTEGIDNKILDEFIRISKNINIYIFCNKEQIKEYLDYFSKYDVLFEILTWHKTNPIPLTKNTFLPDTEYILYFREKGKVLLNDGYHLKSKYFVTPTNKSDKELYRHPTIKPMGIIKNFIEHSSCKGDIVLDCFIGSGTTAVAAQETKRNFIGFEINEEYFKIANDRINGILANGQTSIFTHL